MRHNRSFVANGIHATTLVTTSGSGYSTTRIPGRAGPHVRPGGHKEVGPGRTECSMR